jgi:hypothetical protein
MDKKGDMEGRTPRPPSSRLRLKAKLRQRMHEPVNALEETGRKKQNRRK